MSELIWFLIVLMGDIIIGFAAALVGFSIGFIINIVINIVKGKL